MRTRRSWRTAILGAAVSALVLSACGSDDDGTVEDGATTETETETMVETETMDDTDSETDTASPVAGGEDPCEPLVEDAQADGALTFYGASTENLLQFAADAFNEKYGIQAEFIRLSSSDLQQRYMAEAEAGTFVADVLMQSDTGTGTESFFDVAAEPGYLVSDLADLDMPGYPWQFPSEFLRTNRAVVQIQPWLISYNTEIVTDPPVQWDEMVEDRFADLILLPDPRSSGAYVDVWLTVLDEYGEEYFEQLMSLNPRFYESGVPATEALGAGEGGIEAPSVGGLALGAADRGAPVDITIPDVTTGVEMSLSVTAEEHNENIGAAKLFACFMMNEEGNMAFSDERAVFSVFDTAGLPSGYVSPPAETEEQREQIYQLLGQ